MTTLILTFFFLLLVVGGMAIGVILADKPIKGSCGGIQSLGMGGDCDICGGDTAKCDEENTRSSKSSTGSPFYEVK